MEYTEILNLLKSQQQSGLEQLYENYGKKFYNYCIRQWSLTEDDAWEIIYKTLETLVLKLSNYEFESQAHFDNFLFKVLINFVRQYFRSRRHQEDYEMVLLDFQEEDHLSSTVTKLLNEQSFKDYYALEIVDNTAILALKDALTKIDEQEKDILLLRAQNYSYDEIAKFLGIENNQLKVKYHRAKKKLIQILIENQSH